MRFSHIAAALVLAGSSPAAAQLSQHDSSSIIRSVAALLLGRIQPLQRDSVAVLSATGDTTLTNALASEMTAIRRIPTARVRADSQKNWGVYRAAWAIESAKLSGDKPSVTATLLTTAGSGPSAMCAQFFRVGESIVLVRNGADWRVSSFRSVSVSSGMCSPTG